MNIGFRSLFPRKSDSLLERNSSSSSQKLEKAPNNTKFFFSKGPKNINNEKEFQKLMGMLEKSGVNVTNSEYRSMGAEVAYRITKFIAKELVSSVVELPGTAKVFDQMFDNVFKDFSPETNVMKQEAKNIENNNKINITKGVIKILITAFKESLPNITDFNDPLDLEKLKGLIIDTKKQQNDQFREFTKTLIRKIESESHDYQFRNDQKNQLLETVRGIEKKFNEIQWNRDGENASLIGGSIKSDELGPLLTFLSQSIKQDDVENPMHQFKNF